MLPFSRVERERERASGAVEIIVDRIVCWN